MNTEEILAASVEEQAAFFQALADPTRLKLLGLLSVQGQPYALCVKALAARLGVSQPAVSQHLRVLKALGLVKGDRRGYHVHYSVDTDRLAALWEQSAALLGNVPASSTVDCDHQECCNGRQDHAPCS